MPDKILQAAVKVLTRTINDLCAASIDENGKPKAPERKELMKARAMLPAGYSQSLVKEQQKERV